MPIVAPYPTGAAADDLTARSLNDLARNMAGSRILGIASQVKARIAEGEDICNLTVGDFSPAHFKAPTFLRERIGEHVAAGRTNYPPADGIPELRKAIVGYYQRRLGVTFPYESIVVGSGARPPLYAAYTTLLSEGDQLVYAVPSWNNEYYSYLNGAEAVILPTSPEAGFMPTLELLEPYLATARVLHLNSPLNPCGTCIDGAELERICRAIVAENTRRTADGRTALFLVFDMVYWELTFGDTKHHDPISLVPEMAPYTMLIDAMSKSFASTGLRVGWGVVPPYVQPKFKALIGHMGAWAPRPEQHAAAEILSDDETIDAWLDGFKGAIGERLDLIHSRFSAMAADGLPVRAIAPQGAIYLSINVNLIGQTTPAGVLLDSNEAIRQYLLDEARTAIVPFRAFGLEGETGWFRMSIGACGVDELGRALDRVEAAVRSAVG
ncbi:MAG: aminotransferase class I/II-fold pyridoxal phosphate-dependent enzyme [Proteobacteria bacterium]|nr:aminotransferase class I/II-fold pyridoxal phosphate-dependent enzyme [Pseudomonadota bacterium]MCP4915307.1 aminotransferase class I/II-fold pyridoxal phosphate-dependent enzyme [Pseudomonadota bacterium]